MKTSRHAVRSTATRESECEKRDEREENSCMKLTEQKQTGTTLKVNGLSQSPHESEADERK
jgi:hypothetical protein